MDLRQNKRYQMKSWVTFSWDNAQGTKHKGEGYTLDISSYGVYVLTDNRLPVGALVHLEVSLPSPRENRNGVCLRTRGKVVRSEERGFAAVAELGFRIQS